MRRLLLAAVALLLMLNAATAADQATLIADSVTVQSGTRLAAIGHVEVFFKGQTLTAASVIYDQKADRLIITGPIRIDDGKGSVFTAAQADLSADLSEGLLVSARLMLNQQLQLAASDIVRSDGGNVTALRQVVASSCTICAGSPTPLWEIRAKEVVHDAAAQQIYFTDANLRFYGVPVLYLPMLRVPDPSLKRASGFLLPKLRSTTQLGTGMQLPYFVVLGASRDVTITPYFTLRGDKTVQLRYREAYRNGTIEVDGAVSQDGFGTVEPRGYVTASGNFDLGNDYQLTFHGISVSDPAYLSDYGISTTDRLENKIDVTRTRRDLNFSARIIGLQSLREEDNNATLPSTVTDLSYERRFKPALLGGTAGLTLDTHTDFRSSASPLDANGDGVADGRDLSRVRVGLDWRRNWALPSGIAISAMALGAADKYMIQQDQAYGGAPSRLSGSAGVVLRWPWVKAGGDGTTQLLEPIVQLVTASKPDSAIPNGDSTMVEFDEGNLFSLNRFPGADAVEAGTWANIGVNYRRDDASGWSLGMTAGRVIRMEDLGQFSNVSGLSGQKSDWLLAWSLNNAGGLDVTNRLVLDDSLSLTKGEMRFDYATAGITVSGGYEYLLADASEGRADTASEIVLETRKDLTRNWSADLSGRYDLRADRLSQSGLELDFRNECIDVTLSLSRRYASSTSVKPSTDVGLSVELLGFGGGSAPGPSRVCRR
ncbi:MAG: LPS assembly protein LptD [bacterium]